uniref:SET domain-containing protein n=1 Tax=Aegilops tauschii subsp. strangulata TaxID=200361 RepID=A0A453G1R5_AEGTS
MAGNQQPASVVLNDAAVLDAKPLRTLTPMFPAPLGMHTFTIKGSPPVVCVTPFRPYAGGTELGVPGDVLPTSAALSAPADPNPVQPYMVHMNGAANANGTSNNTMVSPVLQTPPAVSTQESGKKKRGTPRRVQDTTVPTAPAVHLVPMAPPVHLVPSVPSAPPEEDDYIFETPPSEQHVRWNYALEVLGESSPSDLKEPSKQLPIVISAKRTGNIARFMNHSCSPNVFWQPVLYDHGDEGYPHIAFFALKHIPPMTELTYDYGQSQGNVQLGSNSGCRRSKNCLCWSRKCRASFG